MYRYRFDEPWAEFGAQRGLCVGRREITDVHPGDLGAAWCLPRRREDVHSVGNHCDGKDGAECYRWFDPLTGRSRSGRFWLLLRCWWCNCLWFADNRLVLLLDGFELLGVVLLHELGTRRLRGNHHCRGLELLCLLVDGFCHAAPSRLLPSAVRPRWDDRDDGGDLVCRFVDGRFDDCGLDDCRLVYCFVDCRFCGIDCVFVDWPWCFGWFRSY